MTGAKLEYHTKAVFTLKSMVDGSSTTVSVSNVQESTVSDTIWPILKAIGAVGIVMGDFLPVPQSSSVTLENAYGSIGDERRFSDLLERYSLINQQVLIYVAASAIGSFTSSDYELRWAGTVKRVRERDEDLVIDIAGRGIRDRVLNLMLSTEAFPSIPSASVGYALPIVIGSSVEVKPVRVAADADTSPEYVYATTLGTQHPVAGINTYYIKDSENSYQVIVSAGTTSNPIFENTSSNTAGVISSYQVAYELDTEALQYGVRGGRVSLQGNNAGAGAVTGQLTIQLCEADTATGAPNDSRILAQTTVDKSQYGTDYIDTSAHQFWIDFSWNTVVPTRSEQVYYLILSGSNETGASATNPSTDNTSSLRRWQRIPGTDLSWSTTTARGLRVEMYGIVFTETTSSAANSQGLGYAQFEITQLAAATGQTNPDLTKLDLIVNINGLKDDSSGTVTGSVSQLIESAQHATELLTKEYNGSTWTGGQFGTEHSATWAQVNTSSSTYFREVSGKTTGSAKLSQFLDQICRASACRITMHPSASTPMGLWAWGGAQTVADYINQDECEILNAEILGTESVINAVEMFYAEKLVGLDYITGSALGEFKSYSARFNSLDSTQSYYDRCNRFSSISRTIFGNLYLDIRTQQWIGDAASANNLALSLLARFAFPSVYYDIELPYQRFKSLKLLDVVILTHPKVAAFFGTTPSASKAVYAAGGVEVDLSTGFHWARANSARFQIEGLSTIFDSENTPRIRASVRLLNNPNDPT